MNDSLNRDYGGKAAAEIRERCTECLLCVEECGFLKHQGTPKGIASSLFSDRGCPGDLPFECSLCRLCDAVCPEGLSPADMFLTLRAECLRDNPSILSRYSRLLRYERLGSSKLLSLRAFPDDCDTVFFPGCNLPGSMPGATERLVREMSLRIPRLGIVIDCCNRPSHDLGREAFFRERFGTQMADLRNHGIAMLITACPNCHELFSRYATGLHVISAFSLMAEWGITVGARGDAALTIHDPCAFRFRGEVTAAARKLLSDSGISFREMTHNGRNTLCCGEGGAVEKVNRNYPDAWRKRIALEAAGKTVITCCGGCRDRLSRAIDTRHLLELWHEHADMQSGGDRFARFPSTYINRVLFKRRISRFIRR